MKDYITSKLFFVYEQKQNCGYFGSLLVENKFWMRSQSTIEIRQWTYFL